MDETGGRRFGLPQAERPHDSFLPLSASSLAGGYYPRVKGALVAPGDKTNPVAPWHPCHPDDAAMKMNMTCPVCRNWEKKGSAFGAITLVSAAGAAVLTSVLHRSGRPLIIGMGPSSYRPRPSIPPSPAGYNWDAAGDSVKFQCELNGANRCGDRLPGLIAIAQARGASRSFS